MAPLLDQESILGTWKEWAKHIISELNRLTDQSTATLMRLENNRAECDAKVSGLQQALMDKMMAERKDQSEELTTLKIEIAILKTKAAMWGAIGASIPVIVGVVVDLWLNHK